MLVGPRFGPRRRSSVRRSWVGQWVRTRAEPPGRARWPLVRVRCVSLWFAPVREATRAGFAWPRAAGL